MTLSKLVSFSKFTTLDELSGISGICTQLGDRDSFYLGKGIFVSITRMQFKIKNSCRIEYGDPGEYCLSVSVFSKAEYAKVYYKIQDNEVDYRISGFSENVNFLNGLKFGDMFSEVKKRLATQRKPSTNLQEGENRGMNQLGKFVFQYDYIKYDNVIYYFFGKPQKGSLEGISYFLI